MFSLFPALIVTAAYYAHILGDRHYWSSTDFRSLIVLSVPLYGSLLGGPLAVTAAGVGQRSSGHKRWSRVAQVGGIVSLAWGLFFAIFAGDTAPRIFSAIAAILSVIVIWSATHRLSEQRLESIA